MPVITIRGQTGSGASDIGRLVARLIEGDYVDRQVIAEVAELVKRPEAQVEAKEHIPPHLFQRIVGSLRHTLSGTGKIDSAYMRTWEEPLDDGEYIEALEAVVRDLAVEDKIVIVGRGSQHILRNNPSVLHVLVVAPVEVRLNRVMTDRQSEREEAERYIEENDASRRNFIQRFFQKDLEDPMLYDLVVSTKYISYETAARLIATAAADKNPWGPG